MNPLGIDAERPWFSWQLSDPGRGARQTAYAIQVATKQSLLLSGKPDVWDSGKVLSGKSIDVVYGGRALQPETRYFWRVQAWDQRGRPYPVSGIQWWETGLMGAANWRARWIGYEDPEHRKVRESGAVWITNPSDPNFRGGGNTEHDFRFHFTLTGGVRRAELFVTGQDTAAAWINGTQVLAPQPLPPWHQAAWQTYRKQDVGAQLVPGRNLLAIAVTQYGSANGNGAPNPAASMAPMSACLYVELADGASRVFSSSQDWKAALNAPGIWQDQHFNDIGWRYAVAYAAFGPKPGPPWPTGPVKILRREFAVRGPLVSARLYATALGAYQFHINGKAVGDQILAPGWTDFRNHVFYQVYDVTRELSVGQNAIAAYLAPGWYTTPLMWTRQGYNYGSTPPALKAQLRLQYADGSVDWIVTDGLWKAEDSPILKAEIYDGETIDARRDEPGWDRPGFADSHWKPVDLRRPVEPQIIAQSFQPIRVEQELTARRITSPRPGVYIYDFGQNLAGVARLQVQGPAGTDVRLRFGEVLNADGTLYVENLRSAKATDNFILAGHGLETFQPAFTYHGFRYVDLTGLPSAPDKSAVLAIVFHTDAPFTEQLRTGSSMVNQLASNILWGQRSNFMSVPTDCPQRDERLGWTADAQVFWRAASYNMDLAQFSKKYARDMRGTLAGTAMYGIFAPGTIDPNPGYAAGWSDAGVIIPWTAWLQSGDTRVIEQNWTAMEAYLAAIVAANPDYLWQNNYGIAFGDWLSPEGPTSEPLIATAYWAYDASLMQQMAHALGKTEDETKYALLFENIRAAFAKAYVSPDGFVAGAPAAPVGPSGPKATPKAIPKVIPGDTQTGYVLALKMNLVPESLRAAVAEKLVAKLAANGNRLGTGFLGTPYLLEVLADTGHADVAYTLLLNTVYPSWGYMVEHGATTMWERWNGDQMRSDPTMNSYNHYAYGAVADWIYRYAAGIDAEPRDPGFHTVYLHPNFDRRLAFLDFSYASPYGTVRSQWSVRGKTATWRVTIPPNAVGRLPLPDREIRRMKVDGRPLAHSSTVRCPAAESGQRVCEIPAGSYAFEVRGQ